MIKPKDFYFDEVLVLNGLNLKGEKTFLKIGEILYELDPLNSERFVSNNTIRFKLNDQDLKIGVHTVQVIHKLLLGNPLKLHDGFESNNLSINLCPRIKDPKFAAGLLEFNIDPKIRDGQTSEIILYELTDDRTEHAMEFTDEVSNALLNKYFVDKPAGIVPDNKDYLIRVRVDNLYSQLGDDYSSPKIKI